MSEIEAIVRGGVNISFKPVRELEGKRVKIKIVEIKSEEPEKLYSYLRLLREGKDTEELFEI